VKNWYSVTAKSEKEFEVLIYDEIGIFGITAKQFVEDFKKIPASASVVLRINSPGGDVFDSLAIYNVIRRHGGPVNATIDGLAASAASIIAMAAKHLAMPDNTFLMIHNASGLAIGEAEDMRALAELLDKISTQLTSIYAARSGQSVEKIAELMSDETWLTAQEAKQLGLADEVLAPVKLAARADLRTRFKRLPDLLAAIPAPQSVPAPTPAIMRTPSHSLQDDLTFENRLINDAARVASMCVEAGFPQLAAGFIERVADLTTVGTRLEEAKQIREVCHELGVAHRAITFILAGYNIEQAKAELHADFPSADMSTVEGREGWKRASLIRGMVFAASARFTDREERDQFLAAGEAFIFAGWSVQRVRAHLFDEIVRRDNLTVIDGRIGVEALMGRSPRSSAKPLIDYKEIYRPRWPKTASIEHALNELKDALKGDRENSL
jgi:ATP-dependent Clp endopeptidase proteolytic subunit ClpP